VTGQSSKSADSEDPGSHTPSAGPCQKSPKSHLKIRPQKKRLFSPKMMPRGPRKGDPKSQKVLLDTSRSPSGETVAPSLEKSASRALPGTTQYASRTVPAMVLARSRRCQRTPFFITFGSHLAPFLALWAPKRRPGATKGRPPKNNKKTPPQKCRNVPKMPS